MTDPTSDAAAGPFAQAAGIYFAAKWTGILPLPARSKKAVPTGYTGHDGVDPHWPDIQAWIDGSEGAGNIALRLPHDVVGLDVDNYDDKLGLSSYGSMLAKWGPLPRTWRSSSRADGHSGIYLFSVPPGLAWPGAPRPGIEIIQYGHRYVVAWPSIHPEGGLYRWHDPGGAVALNQVPGARELPALPDAWVQGLTGGQANVDLPRAGVSGTMAREWLEQHGQGDVCADMAAEQARYVNEFATSGLSRHDIAMRATARITRMIQDGHRGGNKALLVVQVEFDRALARTAHRDADAGEWARLIDGAVDLAAAYPVRGLDPCDGDPAARAFEKAMAQQQRTTMQWTLPAFLPPPTTTAAAPAVTPEVGTVPSAPETTAGALTLAQQLLGIEIERLRAQRGARRAVDEEEAVALFRTPVWVRTLTEELQLPDNPVPFVVAQVMPAGANVLLTAQFKAGKTTLVNNLTRSLVDGQPFLDKFDVDGEHRVGLFNYEVGRDQFRVWLRDAAITNTEQVTVLNLRGYRMPLITPRIEDWIVEWLKEHGTTCWVLDPFARAFVGSGDNENDNSLVGRFLDALDIIKERAGVRELVMPTHTGRAVQEVGSERARGATRLDDWADVRWLLTVDDEDKRYFRAIGRDVDFAEVQLGYNAVTRRTFIEGPGRKKAAAADRDAEILAAVRATPGISTNGIYQIVGGGKKPTLVKIAALVQSERLRRTGDEDTGYRHFVHDGPILSMVPEVVPEGGSGGSGVVLAGGSPATFRSRNHGGSENEINEHEDPEEAEEPVTSLSLNRDQLADQTAAYRDAMLGGKKPRYEQDGTVIDAITGEVIWSP